MNEREFIESTWCCNENILVLRPCIVLTPAVTLAQTNWLPYLCYVQGIGSSMFTGQDHVLLKDSTLSKKTRDFSQFCGNVEIKRTSVSFREI